MAEIFSLIGALSATVGAIISLLSLLGVLSLKRKKR